MKKLGLFDRRTTSASRGGRWLVPALLVACSMVWSAFAQPAMITLNLQNSTVLDAVRAVNRQSDNVVSFMREEVERETKRVSLSLDGVSVESALEQVLDGTRLRLVAQNGNLLIAPAGQQATGRITVTGVVTGAGGAPMVGVGVYLKSDDSFGTVTGRNGRYSMSIPASGSQVIVFSFLGYETREVTIEAGHTEYDVRMKETSIVAEGVVVTGITNIREPLMTGSYVSKKADDLHNNGLMTLEQMLQGQIAGMMVNNPSGLVGTRQKVRVRGTSTLLGNQDVLWVVDGIVQSDPLPFRASDLNNFIDEPGSMDMMRDYVGSAIAWLNPSDIDRITVLKDAASTVLYGVKAANGVIVITTKKGEAGRLSVNYRGGITVSNRLTYKNMNLMNSQQRIDVSREIYERRLNGAAQNSTVGYEALLSRYLSKEIDFAAFDSGVKYLEQLNTDWFDALFRTPMSHSHSLSLSGGEEKIAYYVSVNASQNLGTAIGNDDTRYGASVRLDSKIGNKVTLSAGLSTSISNTSGFYKVDPYLYASTTSRTIPLYDTDGSLFYYPNPTFNYNVINEREQTGNDNELKSVNLSANMRWDILEGLNFESTFGFTSSNSVAQSWASERSNYVTGTYRRYEYGMYGGTAPEYQQSPLPHGGELNTSESRAISYTWRNQLAYNRVLGGRHRVGAMVGTEMRSERRRGKSDTFFGYLPDMGMNFAQPPLTVINNNGTVAENYLYDATRAGIVSARNNYLSFYGNVAYSFDERYIASVSLRNDASNRFGQDRRNRFLPVWSVGGRWNIHNEPWMLDQTLVSELNIHASYGWQGNVVEGYGPDLILNIPGDAINEVVGEPQLKIGNLPYADLRWEKTGTVNVGIDLGLWGNRLTVTAEYYRKNTSDLITLEPLPYEYGMLTMPMNGGTMLNYGWELSMSGAIVRNKDFVWTMNLNTARNFNKITSEIDRSADWRAAISGRLNTNGYPTGALWAFRFDGIDQTTGAPLIYVPTMMEMPEAATDVTKYMKYMGQIDPQFSGGLGTMFRYRTLTLSANFNINLGGKRFLYNMFKDVSNLPSPYNNLPAEFDDRWREPGDKSEIPGLMIYRLPEGVTTGEYGSPRVHLPGGTASQGEPIYSLYNYSTARVVSASYFRCNNISLAYNFTEPVLDHLRLKNLQLTASVSNPFIIVSSEYKGMDPEVATGRQPISKVWSFAVNIGF